MTKKVRITFEEWDHTCADGCCYDYGTKIYVDGKLVEHYSNEVGSSYVGSDPQVALESVLKHLGYKVDVEFKHKDDNGE